MEKRDRISWKAMSPSLRVIPLMLILTGIAYPLSLLAIGQPLFPFQSNGSIVNFNGKAAGSELIGQTFNSTKFFHSRPASDSASGADPHITPEDAYSQVKRISQSTGITENPLKTLIRLNIETNRSQNLGVFAPDYVNVLTINLDLMQQYPDKYIEFTHSAANTTSSAGDR